MGWDWIHKDSFLLAGQLAVEAGEGDAESLKGAHGVVVVHCEDVLGHASELHDDVVD